ncbi:MAG: hypothetical protein N3A66_02660, partial [Planctomycetota bacterium]|nr:hypothetical protein [Planctomycetota bacterium]
PGSYDAEWFKKHGDTGLADTGMEAWEHYPLSYHRWKREQRLPTLVGSSDTHSGTFDAGERTAILSDSPSGEALANAVRGNRTALVSINEPEYAYGPDEMLALVAAALADSAGQREQTAALLREAVGTADLASLLRLSPARPLTVEELKTAKADD